MYDQSATCVNEHDIIFMIYHTISVNILTRITHEIVNYMNMTQEYLNTMVNLYILK